MRSIFSFGFMEITYTIERSLSSKLIVAQLPKKFCDFYGNLKDHNCTFKSPPLTPVLNQVNQVHFVPSPPPPFMIITKELLELDI
jgi:hypothetical protein